MKKMTLLIFHKDYQDFLLKLRELGVVHIHENKKIAAEDERLKDTLLQIKRVRERARLMDRRMDTKLQTTVKENGLELIALIDDKIQRIDQINQTIITARKDKILYEPWGELPRRELEGINEAGWDMRFFIAPDKKYMTAWEEKYNLFDVASAKGQRYFGIIVPVGEPINIEAEEFIFPVLSSDELNEEIKRLEHEKEEVNAYLDSIAGDVMKKLNSYRIELLESADLLRIDTSRIEYVDNKIVGLEGWVPAEVEEKAVQWLQQQDTYYELSEPTMQDNPPIKLKNNKFAKLFEFIGELYALPNYRELDLTPFFAPFFLLFFGLCLGDSGYGLLILVAITIFKFKAKPSMKPILSLAQWLGASTVIMGIVSGTFFGIQLLDVQIPWVERLRMFMLDSQQLFNLALILGCIQIIFGMFLKVVNISRQYGFAASLSTIGWLVLILGGGCCYVLSEQYGMNTDTLLWCVLGVAGLLILFLNNVRRNVFVNIGAGLWDSYNMVTGLLGDVLSYIRLFALGISSSVLGLVFNDLAMNTGDVPVVSQLLMVIILLFGHGINLFIAGLGSFVHPMRLTFVEFYKNSGFEGGGKKYSPLKVRSEE